MQTREALHTSKQHEEKKSGQSMALIPFGSDTIDIFKGLSRARFVSPSMSGAAAHKDKSKHKDKSQDEFVNSFYQLSRVPGAQTYMTGGITRDNGDDLRDAQIHTNASDVAILNEGFFKFRDWRETNHDMVIVKNDNGYFAKTVR